MGTRSENRDSSVKRIISEPLEVIESEYGLAGIDHVLEIVQERRNSIVFSLEQERERANS